MIDLSNVLKTSADVSVQAHWDPIGNTANNLHWAAEEKFNRTKAQWSEPIDMTWEQWLVLFNPGPAHPVKNYSTTDFQVFLPPSTVNVGEVWDLDPEGVLPVSASVSSRRNNEYQTRSKRGKSVLTGDFA